MNVLFFVFFFCLVEGSKYQTHKKTNGFDYRPGVTKSSPLQLYRISKYFEKKRLLDTLENPRISIHVKLGLLPKTELKPLNIFAGGLMKDFLFDMDDFSSQ
jgi:hypothetical protein